MIAENDKSCLIEELIRSLSVLDDVLVQFFSFNVPDSSAILTRNRESLTLFIREDFGPFFGELIDKLALEAKPYTSEYNDRHFDSVRRLRRIPYLRILDRK